MEHHSAAFRTSHLLGSSYPPVACVALFGPLDFDAMQEAGRGRLPARAASGSPGSRVCWAAEAIGIEPRKATAFPRLRNGRLIGLGHEIDMADRLLHVSHVMERRILLAPS
jgi:hypothetical protein